MVLQKLLNILMVPLIQHFVGIAVCLICYFFIYTQTIYYYLLTPVKYSMALAAVKDGSSLQYCHKLPDVFEQLSVYSIKLHWHYYISVFSIIYLRLFISLMQLVNQAQFLNVICLLELSACVCSRCFLDYYCSFNKYIWITIIT